VNQRDRLFDVETLFSNVRRLSRSDQRVERLIDGRDIAAFDERTGDVWASDGSAGSELLDALSFDPVSEGAEPLDHAPAACLTRFAKLRQPPRHAFIKRIERVRENVHVDACVLARQLDAGNQRERPLVGVRFDLEIGSEIVVIADGNDIDAGFVRDIDDLAGRARTVGMVGVRVKVGVTQSATRTSKLS
jgi:hypothetical protein